MPKKILVADDSATIQRAVKIALSEEDLTLVAVRNASEVLATVRSEAPDAILLDNQFHQDDAPDGYGLCAALKQDPGLSHIPIAFLASRSYDKGQGEESGAVLFFEKPFESKTLIEGVAQLLEFAGAPSAFSEPEAPAMPLFTDMVEDEDEGETVISTSFPSSPSLPEAPPAPAPVASLAQPVPRETTAMPTFNPVAFSNLLGDEAAAPAAEPDPVPAPEEAAPPLFSPPPTAPAPAEQLGDVAEEPPAFAAPAPPTFSPEPPSAPPAFGEPHSAGVVTPPPLEAPPMPPAPPSPPPLSAPPPAPAMPEPPSFKAPATAPFGAPAVAEEPAKPRKQPLIIPAPSDEPREFPVKDLLAPSAPAEVEDDLEMEAPVFLDQQPAQSFAESEGEDRTVVEYVPSAAFPDKPAVAPQTDTAPQASNLPALAASAGLKVPSFALNPKEDYLARALSGSRRTSLRKSSGAGTSVQVQAVQELAGETIERIAWEVVPELAELIIREMIGR